MTRTISDWKALQISREPQAEPEVERIPVSRAMGDSEEETSDDEDDEDDDFEDDDEEEDEDSEEEENADDAGGISPYWV